jgi:ADP-ribosyl-[dinitrogen reductase] hydrolase
MADDIGDRLAGCLLGGAIGDALGAGIEFLSIGEIRARFGRAGVTGYVPAYGRLGAITDDTQMTLFTLEGTIRASVRARTKGICHAPTVVRHAYQRWYHTQGHPWPPPGQPATGERPDGWLVEVPELHARRAPGTTCLSALAQASLGTPQQPLNDSKGCGGVMRAAPAGFPAWSASERFRFGCEIAALTHGHPSGYLPAGYLATAVGALVDGTSLGAAFDEADAQLVTWPDHDETLAAVRAGRALGAVRLPSPEDIEQLGGGWVGEEALAIAIGCAQGAPDFRAGVLAAMNHSGDSDSTGAIAGNLLGAYWGTSALPEEWLAELELRDVIEQLATDAARELRGPAPRDPAWFERYPGW